VIAEKVASRLGWKLWDQLLTDEIARRMDCEGSDVEKHEEKRDPAFYRLLKSFMRGSFEGSLNARRLKWWITTVFERSCCRSFRKSRTKATL
jgi:Cytidylate kinase-like family